MSGSNHGVKAHRGVVHWRQQRLSALILIPLTIWLLWATTRLAGADYALALEFFSRPAQKGFAIALIGLIAFHAQIGIQVICEDYVGLPWFQSTLIWLSRAGCVAGFLLAVFALLNLPAGS